MMCEVTAVLYVVDHCCCFILLKCMFVHEFVTQLYRV